MRKDLTSDDEFLKLEKQYPLLSRFREKETSKIENKKIILSEQPVVIVDIETTGLDPTKTGIIEIGAMKVQNEIFVSLIKPSNPIPAFIEGLTGITDKMVEDERNASSVFKDFLNFIEGHILIAHNSDFDFSFLKYHIKNALQKDIPNKILCTVKLSRALIPGLTNYKLHTVAKHFDIPISNRHRAMGDVEITTMLWGKLIEIIKAKGIDTFDDVNKFMK